MQAIRRFLLREHNLVFLFCMAVMTGPAIAILFAFDLSQTKDCYTYLGLAQFDFDQSPVRRFRVIIPFAAAALNKVFGGIFSKLAPSYFRGDFGLPFSFFVINISLMSYYGVLIYRYCKAYGLPTVISILGLLVMLTCRYTSYTAALPMVDSLFCVVVAMVLLGIKEQHAAMLITAIFLGPFAKEAFIFIAPLIFFYSHIDKRKLIAYFLLSGILVFTYRYVYERYAPAQVVDGLRADLYHFYLIPTYAKTLLSGMGLYKMASNLFVWLAVPVAAYVFIPGYLKAAAKRVEGIWLWFMASVVLQMVLSGSLERMFYISMPVLCLWVAATANELKKQYAGREK